MHHRLPVIGFDAGGIGEWLRDGETGFLVPARDHVGMGQAIGKVIFNQEIAQQLGSTGYQDAIRDYIYDHYVPNLEAFLNEAIEHRHGKAPLRNAS